MCDDSLCQAPLNYHFPFIILAIFPKTIESTYGVIIQTGLSKMYTLFLNQIKAFFFKFQYYHTKYTVLVNGVLFLVTPLPHTYRSSATSGQKIVASDFCILLLELN